MKNVLMQADLNLAVFLTSATFKEQVAFNNQGNSSGISQRRNYLKMNFPSKWKNFKEKKEFRNFAINHALKPKAH